MKFNNVGVMETLRNNQWDLESGGWGCKFRMEKLPEERGGPMGKYLIIYLFITIDLSKCQVFRETVHTHQQHGLFMKQLLLQDLQVPLFLLQLTTDVLLPNKHATPHPCSQNTVFFSTSFKI